MIGGVGWVVQHHSVLAFQTLLGAIQCLGAETFFQSDASHGNESFQTTENKGEGSKAESLMIAGLFVVTGKDYVALCKQLAKEAANSHEGTIAGLAEEDYLVEAERMQQAVDAMNEAVKQHGWDGEWFLRAYDFFGNKIGSDENEDSR